MPATEITTHNIMQTKHTPLIRDHILSRSLVETAFSSVWRLLETDAIILSRKLSRWSPNTWWWTWDTSKTTSVVTVADVHSHVLLSLLSTHADRQGVDISFTVWWFVCNFVQLPISPVRIKLAASNFARWFQGCPGQGISNFGNSAPAEAQNRTAITGSIA